MRAVSNTSPLSNLAYVGRLDLLREQLGEVWVPEVVWNELSNIPDTGVLKTIDKAREIGWLKLQRASDANLTSLLRVDLHPGEAEAIALSLETKADVLLIDEREGRAMARQLGVRVTGVLGVLLRAKRLAQIGAIKPGLEALRTKARFFMAPALEEQVLAEAGE